MEEEKQPEAQPLTPPKDTISSISHSQSASELKPPPQATKRASKVRKAADQSFMPQLASCTLSRDTYDIDYLLEVQARRKPKGKDVSRSSTDFVRKNIADTRTSKPELPSDLSTVSLDRLMVTKRTMKPSESAELFRRLVNYKQHHEHRCKAAKEELLQKEIEKCTFAPELVAATNSYNSNRRRRRPEDLYYAGILQARETQLKQDKLREELCSEPSTFHPELNQVSVKLAAGRGRDSTPVYEKLYGAHKTEIQNRVQRGSRSLSAEGRELTFRPSINKRSGNLSRDQKVDDALYQDAQRRKERQRQVQAPPTFETKTSAGSERVLRARFEQDFSDSWAHFSASDLITTQFVLRQLLQDLGLEGETDTCTSKVWDALDGARRAGVRQKALLVFLEVALRLKPGCKLVANRPLPEGRFVGFQGDELTLCQKDIERIRKAFSGIYEARLTAPKRPSAESKPEAYKSLRSSRPRSVSVSSRASSQERPFTQRVYKANL